ncbi:MAG TPA: sigma-70 family RNA polymerase sigma factor, partial [Gemmataceae bacterium]|nr:sigma-70 family RNA polymerase sigma factor [Gemmataceae bacterium]
MAEPSTSPVLRHLRRLAAEPPGDALTDRQLLARFAAGGDGGAFAELVRRHGPMVLAVCRRVLGNEADAEDAFQATFLVLARKAAATRWEASAAGWLYEVARRVASDMRARARRRLAHEARATLAREEAAVAGADWGELQEALDGELGRLPKRYREPLLLCYWQGLTRDAAARRLGLPLRTLDRRLAQGRDRLR